MTSDKRNISLSKKLRFFFLLVLPSYRYAKVCLNTSLHAKKNPKKPKSWSLRRQFHVLVNCCFFRTTKLYSFNTSIENIEKNSRLHCKRLKNNKG